MFYDYNIKSNLNADILWMALSKMDHWLCELSTIKSIIPKSKGEFFTEGFKYDVKTPEKITMHATITKIDEDKKEVIIDAHAGFLKSHLTCRILEHENYSIIQRRQEYPGIFGKFFTKIKGAREKSETKEYLKTWLSYAQELEKASK